MPGTEMSKLHDEQNSDDDEVEDTEDWCFICKDGGELILCDYGGCTKVYHKECVQREESSEEADQNWNCARHFCCVCKKESCYHCYACPTSVCKQCVEISDFTSIRGMNGLCDACLRLVLIVESSENPVIGEVTLDLKDRETFECLFLEYWNIIKEKESLTKEELNSATSERKHLSKFNDLGRTASHKYDTSDSGDDRIKSYKRVRVQKSGSILDEKLPGRKYMRKTTRGLQFEGWCSKPLSIFLKSIGEVSSSKLPQLAVESLIIKYAENKQLWDQKKRKKIICDEALFTLFRRKSVRRNAVFHLLRVHFPEKLYQSDDSDEIIGSFVTKKKQISEGSMNLHVEKDQIKCEQSCFASIVAENINLIYLKRSLVEDLLKNPVDFDDKVVGSFVRVKIQPLNGERKIFYQLLQVNGMTEIEAENINRKEVLLQVNGAPSNATISSLSDSDFFQEELEDLKDRIEKKLQPKLLVMELEEKARCLHKDVTMHWIQKELERLQNLINLSNEKGWRAEMAEYIAERDLLKTPCEQERLMRAAPKVIPEPCGENTENSETLPSCS